MRKQDEKCIFWPHCGQSGGVCVCRLYIVQCSFHSTFTPLGGHCFHGAWCLEESPLWTVWLLGVLGGIKATCLFALWWCILSFCSPREECICAQTLLLQLLQSCFLVLQRDSAAASEDAKAPRQSPRAVEAAKELYTHLCDGRIGVFFIVILC